MRPFAYTLLLGSLVLSSCGNRGCGDQETVTLLCDGQSGTFATVRDLTGKLDGCGKVLELASGKRLEPSGPL